MTSAFVLILGLSEPMTKETFDRALKEITDKRPDAFMEGVYQRQFNQSGQLDTTLTATSLLDFGSRANAEITNPLTRASASRYIKSDHGELTVDRNRLYLTTNVIADRFEEGRDPWRLSGETLQWDQTTDLVTAKTTTTLVQGRSQA